MVDSSRGACPLPPPGAEKTLGPGQSTGSTSRIRSIYLVCKMTGCVAPPSATRWCGRSAPSTAPAARGAAAVRPVRRAGARLMVLWLDGPKKVGALQKLLALSSPTLTGALDRMEAAGLVRRRRERRDGPARLGGQSRLRLRGEAAQADRRRPRRARGRGIRDADGQGTQGAARAARRSPQGLRPGPASRRVVP